MKKIDWKNYYYLILKDYRKVNKLAGRYQKERLEVLKFIHSICERNHFSYLNSHDTKRLNAIIKKLQRP